MVKEIAKPSVMSLLVKMCFNGQLLATGTAFVAIGKTGPMLVTNRHNVTGRHQDTEQPLSKTGGVPNEIVILHNQKENLCDWIWRTELLYDVDQPRWKEHPTLGARADFVALPLTSLEDVEIYPYDPSNPGPSIMAGPAEALSVVGFPFGMNAGGSLAVWATGFIASEPSVDFNNLPVFLIDCRSRQGQSGSAVIAYRSGGMVSMAGGSSAAFGGPVFRFLGIYSGRVNQESDLGIVWKASAIAELIDVVGT